MNSDYIYAHGIERDTPVMVNTAQGEQAMLLQSVSGIECQLLPYKNAKGKQPTPTTAYISCLTRALVDGHWRIVMVTGKQETELRAQGERPTVVSGTSE